MEIRPNDEGPLYLPRRQVARLFGVSVSTVTRWAQQGRLPAVRTPGGHYRFPAVAVRRIASASISGADPLVRLD